MSNSLMTRLKGARQLLANRCGTFREVGNQCVHCVCVSVCVCTVQKSTGFVNGLTGIYTGSSGDESPVVQEICPFSC